MIRGRNQRIRNGFRNWYVFTLSSSAAARPEHANSCCVPTRNPTLEKKKKKKKKEETTFAIFTCITTHTHHIHEEKGMERDTTSPTGGGGGQAEEERGAKRSRQAGNRGGGGGGSLLVDMPYELTLEVVERAAGAGAGAAGELRVLKVLRQVSRELNHIATDVLVATYVRHLEALVEQLRKQVEQAWARPAVSEERAAQLSGVVEQVAAAADELQFLRSKLDDKKSARATIFRMQGIDHATRWHLLKACSFESELLGLKCALPLRAISGMAHAHPWLVV